MPHQHTGDNIVTRAMQLAGAGGTPRRSVAG